MRYAIAGVLVLIAAVSPLRAQEPITTAGLLTGLAGAAAGGSAFQRAMSAQGGSPDGTLETDRDAFTPSTRVASQGRLVAEAAYSFIDNRDRTTSHSFPELLLRYGLLPRLELRFGWNADIGWKGGDISSATGHSEAAGVGVAHEYRVSYGLKAGITSQGQWIPQSSLIVQGLTPTGGDFHASQIMATYAFGWQLPGGWRADAAMRYNYGLENGDHFTVWAPSAVLRIPLLDRFGANAEYFGVFTNGLRGRPVNYASGGLHYLLSQDFEIGTRVGFGLNEQAPRFFVNAGIGMRF